MVKRQVLVFLNTVYMSL